jgi:integrase
MNFVEPIRDPAMVEDIANYLKKTNERNYIMFLCGIYTGLRISDILKLKVSDVKNRNNISIREKKTQKQRIFEINPLLKRELATYVYDKEPDEYLIQSRQNYNKPLTRSMAYKILQGVAEQFNLECIGCHTLRKTFGYHFYRQYKDVVTLQRILNHSHPGITLRYIGIEQESINKAIKKFKIY